MEFLKVDRNSIITIDSFFTCDNWYIQYENRLFSKKFIFELRKQLTFHILNSQNLSHTHFEEFIWMEIGKLTFGSFYHRCLEGELLNDNLFKNGLQDSFGVSTGGFGGGGCSGGGSEKMA